MPYSAMIFLMASILCALVGFGPIEAGVAESARVLAIAFAVLCVVALAMPYLRSTARDTDEI